MDELNLAGKYRALYINVESAQAMRENVPEAMHGILNQISEQALFYLKDPYPSSQMEEILRKSGTAESLFTMLRRWRQSDPRPAVLIIDEIDSLIGDTLVSVLRQLRFGYLSRP